ncbi:pyridoxal-phosphate dependent enzyme [Streptomyces xiamenensis]|uniref:pyridoxal-phosphate dependent enzyme n=1 Tax=Streptomyces xiamenensis TaxID=408015 RepID=UPI0036E4C421
MRYDSIHDVVGNTPLVRLRTDAAPDVGVYAKLELHNLFGMKDRAARNIILTARRIGTLAPGATIVESSSGTMALGVALVGTSLGHPVHIVTDPRIDPITLAKLRALGCTVDIVDAMSDQGWQGTRLERLREVLDTEPGAFWPQQYGNPDNPAAYRALADEILQDLGSLDVLVGAVGSGGSLTGTARALRAVLPDLFVVGVDCVGSALFDQPDRPGRLQSGLGNSLMPGNLDRRMLQEIHWLNDHEAFAATRDLAREQQIFAGNTSGSVYRVLCDLARRSPAGTRIVGILPDRGDRYADSIYSDRYWDEHRLGELSRARESEPVDYGVPVHSWSRAVNKGPVSSSQFLLFVESNTTGTGMLAIEAARSIGVEPVLLTGDPGRYAGLDATECTVVVCDTTDGTDLRGTLQRRFRREELAGITTTSEYFVPLVAELAEWLGLPSSSAEAVARCRNKALTRDVLRQAGVRQPGYAVLDHLTPAHVRRAVETVGLPCVVKPVDDSGSHNVLLCTSPAAVFAQAERILAVTTNARGQRTARAVLVEEYLDGPEFSVEMFSSGATPHCIGITEKIVSGSPHFIERQHFFPATVLSGEQTREIEELVRRALEAVGPLRGATHTEVRITPEGPAVVEINPRPAGGMIPELIRLTTGADLLERQLGVMADLPVEPLPGPVGVAGIRFLVAGTPGELTGVEGVAEARATEGVEEVRVTARIGSWVAPPRSALDRLGFVIASGATRTEVKRRLDAACSRITLLCDPPGGRDRQRGREKE